MRDYFVIDLEARKLEVCLYPAEIVSVDLDFYGLKDPLKLSDFNWRVFESETKANIWLERYKETLKNLNNNKICKSRELPAMLYKRRYLVQTLLGEKSFTQRSYLKKWSVGTEFNLHDQTYFLTVRLKKITDMKNGGYRYDFELAS